MRDALKVTFCDLKSIAIISKVTNCDLKGLGIYLCLNPILSRLAKSSNSRLSSCMAESTS